MNQTAKSYLESMAPLSNFWIYRSSANDLGVIHYSTANGQSWTLLEDDENAFDKCIELLESIDCPVFHDVELMKQHVAQLSRNVNCDH